MVKHYVHNNYNTKNIYNLTIFKNVTDYLIEISDLKNYKTMLSKLIKLLQLILNKSP